MKKQSCAILLAFLLVGWMPSIQKAASREPARARQGMVAATTEIASRVGAEILQRGGNAVDAAVAVGLALAVTWPSAGNLGGGGFMVIRRAPGDTENVGYRQPGALAAGRGMYPGKKRNSIQDASTV